MKSKYNDNSIFLPATGWKEGKESLNSGTGGGIWSSSIYTDSPCYAYYLFFQVGAEFYFVSNRYRSSGFPVRPVTK